MRTGAEVPAADLILSAGHLVGRRDDTLRADSVVVVNGRIVAVSTAAGALAFAGPHTQLIELSGRACLPGFVDAHLDPLAGGLLRSRCELTHAAGAEDCLAIVRTYAESHSDDRWIIGAGWTREWFASTGPTAADLDAAVTSRPAFLLSADSHSAWVNSAALRTARIDDRTPDPPDGRIARTPDGRPSGLLDDGAIDLIRPFPPTVSQRDGETALLAAQRELHQVGVTGWLAAPADHLGEQSLSAYLALSTSGDLNAAVSLALPVLSDSRVEDLHKRRRAAEGAGLVANRVQVAPRVDAALPAARSLVETGFSLHLSARDAEELRAGLDLLDSVPTSGSAHQVVHGDSVSAGDADRLAAPHVASVLVPCRTVGHALPSEMVGRVPELPTAALGSDWPNGRADPLYNIHKLAARSGAALRIETLLRAYTAGSARAAGLAKSGHLEVGYRADIVVLDTDLADDDPDALTRARVDMTVAGGRVVHLRSPPK